MNFGTSPAAGPVRGARAHLDGRVAGPRRFFKFVLVSLQTASSVLFEACIDVVVVLWINDWPTRAAFWCCDIA